MRHHAVIVPPRFVHQPPVAQSTPTSCISIYHPMLGGKRAPVVLLLKSQRPGVQLQPIVRAASAIYQQHVRVRTPAPHTCVCRAQLLTLHPQRTPQPQQLLQTLPALRHGSRPSHTKHALKACTVFISTIQPHHAPASVLLSFRPVITSRGSSRS
jgi:hypothetical protein